MIGGYGRREPNEGLKGVTMLDCERCGRPTVFVRRPKRHAVCAGCADTPARAREAARSCPVDGTSLVVESRANVNVQRCPECGGVWLDGGTLDLLLAAAASSRA